MSTAIMLASNGFQVTILEKNAQIGGKLNQLEDQRLHLRPGPVDLYAASTLSSRL